MKTDLVTVKEPITVRTIDDILSRPHLTVPLVHYNLIYRYFSESPTGSKMKKLYRRLSRRELSRYSLNEILVKASKGNAAIIYHTIWIVTLKAFVNLFLALLIR